MSNISKLWQIIKYTIIETTNKKNFIKTNIAILVMIMAIGPFIAYYKSYNIEEDTSGEEISEEVSSDVDKTVHTIKIYHDETCAPIYYLGIKNNPSYGTIEITQELIALNDIENIVKETTDKNTLIVKITYDNAYYVNASIPNKSNISEDEVSKVVDELHNVIKAYKYGSIYASEIEISEANKQYSVNIKPIEENTKSNETEDFILEIIKLMLPMVFSVVMMIIITMYSKNITTSLSTERNSKIIELLTSYAKPKTLIRGKLLGNMIVSFAQIISFVVAIVMSIFLGNYVSNELDGKDLVDIDKYVSLLRGQIGDSAFTVEAIIICVVLVIAGIVFFDVLAGICGSFVGKPEDSTIILTTYTYITMIGYFIALMSINSDNEVLKNILKYIPLCIPYKMPADVLVGNASVNEGLIAVAIMLASSFVLFILMGNIYEKLVFKKFSLKDMLKKLKRVNV